MLVSHFSYSDSALPVADHIFDQYSTNDDDGVKSCSNQIVKDMFTEINNVLNTGNLLDTSVGNFANLCSDFADKFDFDIDNCPNHANTNQVDTDGDGDGDNCDDDIDGDNILNNLDIYVRTPTAIPTTQDPDGDGVNTFSATNPYLGWYVQVNADMVDEFTPCPTDSAAGACETLDLFYDGGFHTLDVDLNDNCPEISNPDQADTDEDNVGDACDGNGDADSILDVLDNCPQVDNEDQADTDGDDVGDVCDDDDDDGILDIYDLCLDFDNSTPIQHPSTLEFIDCNGDADNDGEGNCCDYSNGYLDAAGNAVLDILAMPGCQTFGAINYDSTANVDSLPSDVIGQCFFEVYANGCEFLRLDSTDFSESTLTAAQLIALHPDDSASNMGIFEKEINPGTCTGVVAMWLEEVDEDTINVLYRSSESFSGMDFKLTHSSTDPELFSKVQLLDDDQDNISWSILQMSNNGEIFTIGHEDDGLGNADSITTISADYSDAILFSINDANNEIDENLINTISMTADLTVTDADGLNTLNNAIEYADDDLGKFTSFLGEDDIFI